MGRGKWLLGCKREGEQGKTRKSKTRRETREEEARRENNTTYPELGSDLVAALASLDMHDFTHGCLVLGLVLLKGLGVFGCSLLAVK